ncbi:disease resistance protein RGA2-like [Panicum virgatum]|uniref:disease resistance protein RGA2-like n=1 Tax=Panicum virgatum TaxID=38727 RepID=UPI0019D5D149|nr:disease resistance protein RGA2-like [Panicum virgatum]
MWEDNRKENWDVLLTPLRTNDAKGNMVIITTRKSSVARMTGARHNINLHGLKDEEFWPLFKECAFGDKNHKGHLKLQEIGRKIADKLKGYPLAAKSVGKLLSRRLDDGYWTRILDNSEWKDQKGDDDVIPALKISYNYLPRHLQKCFSYCSIFPKNQRYHVQWLVNIWIAQGFIPLADQHTQAEETGRRYLADLIDWGFFLSEPPRPSLLMHDLVHDLAQIVSSHESFTIEELKPPGDLNFIRHVTVITESAYYGQFDGTVLPNNEYFMQEFANTFCTLPKKDLRTLMLFGAHDSSFARTFHHELGNQIRAVRVLNMEVVYPDLNMLIPNISAFINLRYLWLRSFYRGLKLQLPEAICKLYQLQVLDIKDFNPETVVPKGLHKLRNLRHFFAREQLHAKIASVGDLVFLQELMAFHVRKEHEFGIAQLEKLNEIRGSISIYNLQIIESKEDASKARLSDKQYLTSLRLSWDDMPTSLRKLKIIDVLEPPMCLEKLHIEGYNGSAPSWLGSTAVSLTSLQSLHLEKCKFWSTLPSVDELPLLRELHLINMCRLDKIPLGRGLKVLELCNIPSLKRFVEIKSDQPYENLEVIELNECNSLENLPFQLCSSGTRAEHLFPKLRRVQICDCIKTKLPPFPIADATTDIDVWNACLDYMSFQLSPAADDESRLRVKLEGHRVGEMEILDETILRFSKLKDLQELDIRLFPEVRYLSWEGLQQMTALKKFKMAKCPKLFSSSPKLVLPVSVEEMEFDGCDITGKQLSNLMSSLPFLKIVKVQYCEGIKCLSVGMLVDAHSTMEEGLWDIPPSSLVTQEKLDISLSDIQFCSKNGLGELGSLKGIVIWKCPMLLFSMVSEAASMVPGPSLLPPSLLKLDITDMVDGLLARSKLASLAELCIGTSRLLISLDVCSCTALQKLKIEECDQLQSIEGLQSLTLLTKLEILSCSKLTSVQLNLCTSLEKLNIDGCDALCTLEGSGSLTSLKEVWISTNPVLSYVELHSCWALENLCITKCPALAKWQGFRSLTGIRSLQVSESPGFISAWKSAAEEMMSEGHYSFSMPLECLEIDDIEVLSMPICRQITSLESLKIRGVLYTAGSDKVDMLLEHHEQALQLLTSLKEVTLSHFKHLESLPSKIHALQLLQRLTISKCPCLESLPLKIHALPLLQRLTIDECPCLTSLPEEGLPRSLVEMDLIYGTVELDALCRSIWKDAHFRLYINKVEHLGAPVPHSVEAQLE